MGICPSAPGTFAGRGSTAAEAMLLAVTDTAHLPSQPAVAIVSSDRRIRDGLVSLVIASGGRVVGTACEAGEALSLVGVARPTTVVVDPHVASGDGLSPLLQGFRARSPGIRLLVLAWDGELTASLRVSGADAMVRVDAEPTALAAAILPAGSSAI
jgi:DNA-binding NarL/FixJ family response regulator